MRTTASILLLVLCATAAGALGVREEKLYDAPPTSGGEPILIEPTGVGPVKYTMTPDQVIAVLGNPDEIYYGDTRYTRRDTPSAAHYVFRSAGLSVFFVLGKLRYIAVLSEQYEYPGGVRVGMDAGRAEEILGPFPADEGPPGSGPTYVVNRDGDLYYRIVPYYPGLSLKVDVTTGRVLQLRLRSDAAGGEPFFQEIDDHLTQDMSWSRRTDAEAMKELGIDLGRYILVLWQFGFRAVSDDILPPQSTGTARYYYLKGVTEGEIARQEAILGQSSHMFDMAQPPALPVVQILGLPMSVMMWGNAHDGVITYGRAFLDVKGSPWMVRSLGSLEYRYKGRIGPGSTLAEVFAGSGEPLRAETVNAKEYTFDDRVLATKGEDDQIITYRDAGVVVEATQGVVTWVRRIWQW